MRLHPTRLPALDRGRHWPRRSSRGGLRDGVAAAATGDDVSPANLELVTLTEDRAIITWYTGYTGTDDGLGRMEPAPADGEVHWGTQPATAATAWPAACRRHAVPLRRAHAGSSRARPTTTRRGRTGSPCRPRRSRSSPATRWAPPTSGSRPAGPYSFTTPQPPPGRFLFSIALCNDLHMGETTAGLVGSVPQIIGHPAGARAAALSGGDARVARRRRRRARRRLPARRRRHHGRGGAARPQPGRAAAQPVRCATAATTS